MYSNQLRYKKYAMCMQVIDDTYARRHSVVLSIWP